MNKLGKVKKGLSELCKDCKTKEYIGIKGRKKNVDYGSVVIHKKDCPYIKRLLNRAGNVQV